MYQFFTAKVGKLIETHVATETADENPTLEKVPVAILELDVAGEQDSKPKVVSTLVQGLRTNGKSIGQLLPFKDGLTAHLVFDIGFVRRLKPGTLLRVEWETRTGGSMSDVFAVASLK